ncbi:MAG: hypothetical protein GY804_08330 [Alphaproteobacteria bacterium]|nr:hypothetical protein [Alphaproteobacteria bacterium]
MEDVTVVNLNAPPKGGRRIFARMAMCIFKYYSQNGKCSEQDLIRSGFTYQQINHFKEQAQMSVQSDLKETDAKCAV